MRIGTALGWRVVISVVAVSLCQAQSNENGADSSDNATQPTLQSRAATGDRNAQEELGQTCEAHHDYREALNWFQLAARQGSSEAEVSLAFLYVMGLGVEKNASQAVHWYRLAAEQGNPDGEFNMGVSYLSGQGVEQDQTLARKWLSSALAHGEGGRAANLMGTSYEVGPERDYAEALGWYSKAAEMGYAEAQYNVCRLTAQGFAKPTDFQGAIKWCSVLAESGDQWGQYGMGQINENGIGMPPNLEAAASWYLKSAEQGNPAAQLSLGAMYANGKGVKRNLIQAYVWVALAASRKHPEAQPYLKSVAANMSKPQIAAARGMALKWAHKHPIDPDNNLDRIVYKSD
jgi:uncharacterized protein